MRKGLNIAKSITKPKNWDFNIKSKYSLFDKNIEDNFTINSLLKDLNIPPLINQTKQTTITSAEVDKFNEKLLKEKQITVNNKPARIDTLRIGLVGTKVGMMSLFDRFGVAVPLTVIKVDSNQITKVEKIKTKEDRYFVEVGGGYNPKATLSMKGHFYKNNIPPKKYVGGFKVTSDALLPVGYMLTVRHFMVGQIVDIRAVTKGKGTQGVMARWGFSGGSATHGNSLSHRAPGSIGNREFPARVWPGKKMSGKSGNNNITEKAKLIYKTDYENGLIYVKGGIPGQVDGKVLICDSYTKRDIFYKYILNPTFVPEKGKIYENITSFFEAEDGLEKYPHDNDERLGVSEEEEEGPAEEDDEEEIGTGGAPAGGAAA